MQSPTSREVVREQSVSVRNTIDDRTPNVHFNQRPLVSYPRGTPDWSELVIVVQSAKKWLYGKIFSHTSSADRFTTTIFLSDWFPIAVYVTATFS